MGPPVQGREIASKRHPPKAYLNFERFWEEDTGDPTPAIFAPPRQKMSGGPFKGDKGLGGCRLEETSKNGGVQGGRGVGGR